VPLSFEEREDLDAKARALGLLPPLPGEGQGEYDSYEAALEAARGPEAPASEAPTVDPVLAMAHNARLARAARLGAPAPRMEQPMFAAEPTVVEVPRLPDFQNVQGIDLKKGVAYLDSMEFELGENDLRKLRKFVVQLAHHAFMARLNAAMGLFDPEGTDGNTVQGVRGE
jgi:hypothetical protein